MKKSIYLISIIFGIIFSIGFIHHKSINSLNIPNEVSANWCSGGTCSVPANVNCDQTPWSNSNFTTGNASVSNPNSLGTNCTHHVITAITASIYDPNESCASYVVIDDSNNPNHVWLTLLGNVTPGVQNFSEIFPVTSFLHNNTDGTQTLVTFGMGPSATGTVTLKFNGHCANSQETVTINGFDE